MKFIRPIAALTAAATLALMPTGSALAQRQPPSPEQRIDRLERQIDEVQRRVFPKGSPAATAGFRDDPAATQSSVIGLDQRLDALERQLTDLVRQTEENGSRVRNVESAVRQMNADVNERMSALEQRMSAATVAPAMTELAPPATAAPRPSAASRPSTSRPSAMVSGAGESVPAVATDPAEDAYTEGFRLWEAGQYDSAINSLRAFVSAYPRHRRTSYANNLIGRALLDKGEARAAAEALLANYRSNPAGERAPDSLYYLGQSLMTLGQREQACKAYSELDAVYGSKMRADLKKLSSDAKAQANCA